MPESLPDQIDEADETDKVEAASTETTDVKDPPADSSPAEGAKGSILEAVKAALKPQETSPASKTEGSDSEKAPETALDKNAAKEADPDDLTEEELARLKPKTRKRIENLTAQRRERDGTIAELKPKAEQFDKMTRFIETANLNRDEVNEGFEVMRLLKSPATLPEAYKRLKPIVDKLESVLGHVLPDDLAQAVNEGRITEAHAKELAQTRSRATLNTQEIERRDQESDLQQRRQVFQESQTKVGTAVTEWESTKAKDPDWKLKQPRVMRLVELETLRRQKADPNFCWTPETAVSFSDKALKEVEADMAQLRPKPKAINPVTDVASTRSVAKPSTALEAAKLALSAAG